MSSPSPVRLARALRPVLDSPGVRGAHVLFRGGRVAGSGELAAGIDHALAVPGWVLRVVPAEATVPASLVDDACAWLADLLAGERIPPAGAAREASHSEDLELLGEMYQTLPDGVLVVAAGLQILSLNPAAGRILGLTADEALGRVPRPRWQLLWPDGSAAALHEFAGFRCARTRHPVDGELMRIERPDGTTVWISAQARPLSVDKALVCISDVTELVEARAAAERSSRLWEVLVGGLHEAVALFDYEGRVVDLNGAAEGLLGRTRLELQRGGPLPPRTRDVVNESGDPVTEFPSAQARRLGAPVVDVVLGMRMRGVRRWFLCSAQPLPGVGVVVSLLDFTAIKSARDEMESRKDEFIRTLSHEMRTPLTSVDGALALLLAEAAGGLPQPARELVEIARRSASRLVRLVNDVLDLERILAGALALSRETHDLGSLVAQAVESLRPHAAGLGVSITLSAPERVLVTTDADRVAQILANFLANAIRFSPPGSTVEMRVESRGSRARVAVRDHGPGVPPEFRSRLFTRFAQAGTNRADQRAGAGLGLSICSALAALLQGEVGFEAPLGGGAEFWFELNREES